MTINLRGQCFPTAPIIYLMVLRSVRVARPSVSRSDLFFGKTNKWFSRIFDPTRPSPETYKLINT